MGERDGRIAAPPSEPLLRHLRAPAPLSCPEGIGLGAVPAVRQYPAPKQDHDGVVALSVRYLLRRSDRGIQEPAAEGFGRREVALRQRRPLLQARLKKRACSASSFSGCCTRSP